MQLFIRAIWYFFAKDYEPELALRELTENTNDGLGCHVSKSSIKNHYAYARERISRYMISSIKAKKLGGI